MVDLVGKLTAIEFLECKVTLQSHVKVLKAKYRVKGTEADLAERFLQQKFKMTELKFVCCGWSPVIVSQTGNRPGNGQIRDSKGYSYEITMYSEETVLNQRQDWVKIPLFYIKVTKFLESP